MTPTPCSSCRALVIWTITEAGKTMPVDAEPSPRGNVVVTEQRGKVRSRIASPLLDQAGTVYRLSHFVTCPNASSHRRPR